MFICNIRNLQPSTNDVMYIDKICQSVAIMVLHLSLKALTLKLVEKCR